MLRQQKVRTSHWHTRGFNMLVLGPAGVWVCSVKLVFVCVRVVTVVTTLGRGSRCRWPSAVLTAAPSEPTEARQFGPHQGTLCECLAMPRPKRPSLIPPCTAGDYFHNVSCQTTSHMIGLLIGRLSEHLWAVSQTSGDESNRSCCKLLPVMLQHDTAF